MEAIQEARNYNPVLDDIKAGGEDNIKRFWNILTGQYTPALIPIGLETINYNQNKK